MDSQSQGFGQQITSENSNGTLTGKRRIDDGTPTQTRAKRNRYISVACNECKRRKIKCNGETPCQRCGSQSLDCVYTPNCCTGGFRDSEEFHSMNAAIRALQGQVEDLYAQINAIRGGPEHGTILQQESSAYPIHPSLEQASVQNAFQEAKPSSQGPGGRDPQFQGPTSSAYSFDVANSSLQTMGITQPESSEEEAAVFDENVSGPSNQNQAPTAPMAMHPNKDPLWSINKDEAMRLCRVYDEEMGIMYPIIEIGGIIHRAKFLFTFIESAARTGLISMQLPGNDGLGTDDNNILKMVLATALTVEGHGESELGRRLFQSVREASQSRLWEPVELKGLTLLVIVAQYHFHTDDEIRAYRIIGLAARLSLEMGLHRGDILARTLMSEEERSQASRLFWSIYVLDRRWSFGTGMPFAIQDSDIDPGLPEPGPDTPYLTAMVPYTRLSAKVWYSVTKLQGDWVEISDETMAYLDELNGHIIQWHKSLPEFLQLRGFHDDAIPTGITKKQRRLQIVLYLRANQMRIFLFRPVLHSVTSIVEYRSCAQTVVSIAKDTIRALTRLNQTSDIYRTQQVCFNYFIVSALAVIFLAVAHAPADFNHQVREEFYMALDLVKGFSTKSYVSKRLWKTIKGLKDIGPKLGLISRPPLADANDPHSSAAVAMAGLAGHRVDDTGVLNSSSPLGSAPINGQQMSLELDNLFKAADDFGNMMAANGPEVDGVNGFANGSRDASTAHEGINALQGQNGDFSRLLRALY